MSKRRLYASRLLVCLFLAFTLLLSACNAGPQAPAAPPASETTAPPTDTPMAVHVLNLEASATAQPTASNTPTQDVQPSETVAPTQAASTATATATEQNCVILRDPEDGAELPDSGWWTFAWDAWSGAASYLLEITAPSGWVLSIETGEPRAMRALESLASGGEYSWMVIALDANGQALCQAGPYRFSKPGYQTSVQPGERPDLGPPPT
ncbi:MAG: hypothetical protein JXA78_08545 [Anaerolineales bacterium]|nr:hypothetical protein [Anaerolineales bacterium]